FYGYLFWAIKLWRLSQEKMDKPLVSVVIPTFNSEGTIGICLRSLRKQTYPNIEVVVVDNYSKDKTREIAEKCGARVVLCKAGRSKAKNVAVGLAKGEFILFIDSDMELTPKVVEECLEAIKNDGKIGGAIIPERSVGKSFWVRVRDFERSFYIGTEVESARFFRKDLVERVGGFDEDIVFFEESTLPQKIEKLGYDVKQRISAEIFHHEDNFSLQNWLLKKFYYGKTAKLYKTRYDVYALRKMSISDRLFIFVKNRRFYQKPLYAFGTITLKFLEYLSAKLGHFMG
ncbi:MAG: glycosyltransferase family 2 protein, partial [Candidatus Bathycorpusculaceae bacterium]